MKVVFLTGTRADYGKIKPLINILSNNKGFDVSIVVCGMHLLEKYGNTYLEVEKDNLAKIYKIYHESYIDNDIAYAVSNNTQKVSELITELETDLLIIHGDRAEALSGAIAALSKNIIIGHIEGGEVSGTIDEMFRHAISKLSHIHFVSNTKARERLLKMGEIKRNIHIIGSPDLDVMISELPKINNVKRRYDINFDSYGILLFHPVTTELVNLRDETSEICKAILQSKKDFIVIFPNNDPGSEIIIGSYKTFFEGIENIKVLPSMRFEYFLSLLKHSEFILGNSSCGVREAPFYGLPSINLGTRQNMRANSKSILNINCNEEAILNAIEKCPTINEPVSNEFGDGKSAEKFLKVLQEINLKDISVQKSIDDSYI